jgi:hypothetical protein
LYGPQFRLPVADVCASDADCGQEGFALNGAALSCGVDIESGQRGCVDKDCVSGDRDVLGDLTRSFQASVGELTPIAVTPIAVISESRN